MLEIDFDDKAVTPGSGLVSPVWCVMLRMLDLVADFLLKGNWREDLIDKWKDAFQMLEAVDEGLPDPVAKSDSSINL